MKLFTLLLMLTSATFAQEAEILNLADEIKDEVRFRNHDRRTLIQVQRDLEQALNTLRGQNRPQPPRGSELTCIDRDRDGRDPYVLGYRDPRTLSTTRIQNANVGSLNQCRDIVASSVSLARGMTTLTCISRDNDGRDPWAPAIIQDGRIKTMLPSLGELNACLESVTQSIFNRFAVSLCVSRDNDGRSYCALVCSWGPWGLLL